MSGVSYFRYSDTVLRDMTVFEEAQLEFYNTIDVNDGCEYFLDTYPFLYVSGSITPEVMEENPDVAIALYKDYIEWMYQRDEDELNHLDRDIRVYLSGKKIKNPSRYFSYFINLFMPLIDAESGKLIRGVFAPVIADEPYKNYRIITAIQASYCDFMNKEMQKKMKMKGK